MAHISLTARFSFIAAAFAVASLFAATPALASAPSLSPKVLQCDGSFATGSVTSHPAPTVLVDKQSSSPGLKIGQRRLSVLPATTLALWRFDGNYEVAVSTCYANGCSGGASCITTVWKSTDSNGTPQVDVGRCHYTCGGVPDPEPTDQIPVQLGACPGALPAAGYLNISAAETGPLPGAVSLGLSSTVLTMNGSTQYGTAPNSAAWNLPASYTLAAWVKSTAAGGLIVSQVGATGKWGIAVGPGGTLRHFDSREATASSDVVRGTISAGSWHLVHLVRRNAVDRRFYIDGVIVGTAVASSTNSFSTHPNNAALVIGSLSTTTLFLNGSLDDIRITNNTLSDDDIMLEWNTRMHKFSSNSGLTFSTAAGTYSGVPVNGTTGAVTYSTAGAVMPEPYSATARWIFTGQSIDGESGQSSIYGVTIDVSSPIAPSLTAVATSINDITWSWGAPPRVCLPPGSSSVFYQLVDAAAGSTLIPPGPMAYPTANVGENIAGSPNQLVGRKLRINDTWGSGLSAPTSIYTWANPPLAASVIPSAVSTGSALISWNQNGNPVYTRYLLSLSQSATFAAGVSTPTTLASNFTGNTVPLSGLAAGTTYYARVQAFSGRATDSFGGTETVFVSTSFTTLPGAPNLAGAPDSNVQITWTWTAVLGAQYYTLYDGVGAILYSGSNQSFPQPGLTTNTQYTARVEAVTNNGVGARATATTFTLANNPTLATVNSVYSSSITYTWNGNLNPTYTFYEVAVTTDATFGVVVTTLTVNATTATATGLFPGTTYFARLRSINGSQIYGAPFVNFTTTRTISNPAISVVVAPPSAYVPPNGAVGQWQLDESTGLTAADSSGFVNTAFLTCVSASCVSTPTFVAGPSGLGRAVAFTGLANGLVRVPDAAQYVFIDSITVSAWVNPSSLAQPNGAGIVVRGNGGAENFALDVSGGLYRFTPTTLFSATSTNTIAPGVWTHLIGVYNSTANTATLYVNGQPASTVALVPPRAPAAHDISIGNRQSGIGAYDRGFLGSIDSVRIQHRALSAAEALAEYQGSFISTVTPPAPNNSILIGLAPNAFGAPATLFVSVDPFTNPITITPAVLNAGLTVIPTGFTLVPNSIIEVVPLVNGTPFTQTLGSSASISMPYADANGDNILDNSSPPLAASAIKVYTLNTTVNRWEALQTFIDPASRRATVFTPHFSVFAMFAPLTIGTSLSEVRVYPIPWRPGTRTRFDAVGITFDRLPTSGSIRILNLAGERVREFSFSGGAAGLITWDGQTDGGQRAASGVYFARINGEGSSTTLVKFAIER